VALRPPYRVDPERKPLLRASQGFTLKVSLSAISEVLSENHNLLNTGAARSLKLVEIDTWRS
jgi:predicted lipase